MLAMSMMLGAGRRQYVHTLSSNGSYFILSVRAPQLGWNLDQVVEIILTINPNIEIRSTSPFVGGLHLDGLRTGSQVHVINQGRIYGGVGEASSPSGGPAIRADYTGNLVLTNGSGYIYGGSPNGYAILHNPGTTITWISGATRITGAIGT